MDKRPKRIRRGCLIALAISGIAACLLVGGLAAVVRSPALAAEGSDVLRAVIGDKAVAGLEAGVFQVQDTLERWRYAMGLVKPAAPWGTQNLVAPEPPKTSAREAAAPTADAGPGQPPAVPPQPTPGPGAPSQAAGWTPPTATPLGGLDGEGVWSVYMQDAAGQPIAYRTFIQPDPSRPYAIVGVVAFDTSRTRLHFVLGWQEPTMPDGPKGTGLMADADRAPGVLLAMFNGGFKARHGHFGAMENGVVALPAREGFGTLAIYKDGRLQMGNWGTEIKNSPDMAAWRQNGPLVVHDGQINPEIYNNSPADWGYTVTDVSPTWRSGIGLSADGKTFYYLCGSSLSMEMLAKSMLAAGVSNGMQLDINNYWVHFVAARVSSGRVSLEPLFPDMMRENIDRYLGPYSRDYFYVTLAK